MLLDIPHYDFNWQNSYLLAQPKLLPKGTTLRCEACYNNSESNLANPDPTQTVRVGEQTWEEMMIGYYDRTLAAEDRIKHPVPRPEHICPRPRNSTPNWPGWLAAPWIRRRRLTHSPGRCTRNCHRSIASV